MSGRGMQTVKYLSCWYSLNQFFSNSQLFIYFSVTSFLLQQMHYDEPLSLNKTHDQSRIDLKYNDNKEPVNCTFLNNHNLAASSNLTQLPLSLHIMPQVAAYHIDNNLKPLGAFPWTTPQLQQWCEVRCEGVGVGVCMCVCTGARISKSIKVELMSKALQPKTQKVISLQGTCSNQRLAKDTFAYIINEDEDISKTEYN